MTFLYTETTIYRIGMDVPDDVDENKPEEWLADHIDDVWSARDDADPLGDDYEFGDIRVTDN